MMNVVEENGEGGKERKFEGMKVLKDIKTDRSFVLTFCASVELALLTKSTLQAFHDNRDEVFLRDGNMTI